MSKNKNTQSRRLERTYSVRHALMNYYLLLMFTVFPLFASNRFFNIRHDKFYLFIGITGVAIIAEAVLICSAYCEEKKYSSPEMKVSEPAPLTKLSFTDCAMLALLVVCIISTLLSKHPFDALIGERVGRNNGLLLIAFYVGIYFVITRCYYYMEYVFVALAAGSAIVFLLSILNFHYIDPLGMYKDLTPDDVERFTSTIGNKNLLSSFICVMLPVVVTMSVHTKNLIYRIVYLISSALGFMALMTADSDSGILGIGAIFVVLLIWYSRRISRLKNYFLCLTVMLASARLLPVITYILGGKSKEIYKLQELVTHSGVSIALTAVLALITALLFFLDYKKPDIVLPKAVTIVLGSIILIGVVTVISAVIYFSCIDTETELGNIGSILRINESWGTHRGIMWIKSFEIFGNFSFDKMLFGTGPDTFYYAFSPYFGELSKFGDGSTNAAHNEYINYLITIGGAGLLAYLSVLGGTLVRAVKKAFSNPLSIVCASAVICYSVQAVVNIAQPITTPLFILFIALAETVSRGNADNAELI